MRSIQARKQALNKENFEDKSPEKQRVGLGAGGHFDTDIYGSTRSKFEGYHTYIPAEDAEVRLCYILDSLFSPKTFLPSHLSQVLYKELVNIQLELF